MGKIKVNLSEAFCKKPGCNRGRQHRHHRGHEFLFVCRWTPEDSKQKRAWIERYWKFNPRDIVDLCANHHAEIHLIYDRVIMNDNKLRAKRLDNYTFREAMALRSKLRKVCDRWLERETRGVPPNRVFGRNRTKNQRKAAKKKDGGKKKDG